jgi:hypothetical protein
MDVIDTPETYRLQGGYGVVVFLFLANDERVHHYQRERASIMGLGLWSG